MKTSLIIFAGTLCLLWTASEVIANPAMLPKHEGYPMGKAVDPVSGQSLANDPGQTNATGERSLMESAIFGETMLKQAESLQSERCTAVGETRRRRAAESARSRYHDRAAGAGSDQGECLSRMNGS